MVKNVENKNCGLELLKNIQIKFFSVYFLFEPIGFGCGGLANHIAVEKFCLIVNNKKCFF